MRSGRAAALAAALALAACAPAVVPVELDGTLTILEPRHDFDLHEPGDDWIEVGAAPAGAGQMQARDGGLYLELLGGGAPYALLRRMNAQLLATPYLAWSWRLMGPPDTAHPVQLTVGFRKGVAESGGFSWKRLTGPELPAYDRTLTVSWGHSALRRGTLEVRRTGKKQHPVAVYVARGGGENLGRWWDEAIDLSALHAKAWPGVDMRDTVIVFAGVVMTKAGPTTAANLAALRLSR